MNLIWNRHTRNLMLHLVQFLPIHRGRVMCVSWGGEQYNCNPKEVAEKLLDDKRFEVCFAFKEPLKFCGMLPSGVHSVEIGSFDYFRLLATSQFIISNTRMGGSLWWPYDKKKGQTYIFTGHGASGIKKVEFDANKLPEGYLEKAAEDTRRIDLFLSGSEMRSKVIRSSYRYGGEILKQGCPRNDRLFQLSEGEAKDCRESAPCNKKYLIYTPTFRNNGRRDVYGFDVDRVVDALEKRFGGKWYIRISSHPNMRSYYKNVYDFTHPRMIDVGEEDLQPLLETSDALITDYSSAEMDFSLTKRPVFQLCRDRYDYDRGFYLEPEALPFPYSENDDQLIQNILNFDNDKYLHDLDAFNRDVVGLHETGHATEAVVDWMIKRL